MKTSLLFVLLSAGAVHAQTVRPPLEPEASPSHAEGAERLALTQLALSEDRHARTYFDTDDAGAEWVRGRGYKARFDASGATIFPFLGSDAPALYPVRLSLGSAAVGDVEIELAPPVKALRADATITIDRGVIDERYAVGVESIEQSFVIESLAAHGDLRLSVRVQTDLEASVRANEFVFSNERGGVRYGHASVVGPRGDKIAVRTTLVDGTIRIDVPSELVEESGLPLVVDPLISVFQIDQYQDQFLPDVAYDATNDVYLVVEEEKFASIDDDVYTIRVSPTGANVGSGYADFTTADWQTPRVANLNAYDQFLVVASIHQQGVALDQRYIGGRTTPANAVAFGATIPISPVSLTFGEMVNPDVGGDPYPFGPAYYCVTWQWNTVLFPPTNEITCRTVSNTGALGTMLGLSGGARDRTPAISNGNGTSTWTIAWTRDVSAPTDIDVYAARVVWDGTLANAAFVVESGLNWIEHPSVSSPFATGECVIAYGCESNDFWPGVRTIGGRVLNGASVGTFKNLGPDDFWNDFYSPSVDCDGRYLLLANDVVPDPFDPLLPRHSRVKSFYLSNGNLVEVEGHYTEGGPEDGRHTSVCAARSAAGPATHFLAVHDRKPATGGRSVWGVLYDAWLGGPVFNVCRGDGSGTACPCSNSGTSGHGCANSADAAGGLLHATGAAIVGSDSLVLTVSSIPNGGCLFFQGTGVNTSGSVFGDGKFCLLGTITRMGVSIAAGGTTAFPAPGGTSVSVTGGVPALGGERSYQAWYRDNGIFCTSDSFNLTNALRVVWIP